MDWENIRYMTWIKFNYKEDWAKVSNKMEVKTSDGKVHSITSAGSTELMTVKYERIFFRDIVFYRERKDWNRYQHLQKSFEFIGRLTDEPFETDKNSVLFELFDHLDYILEEDGEAREKLEQIQKKLNRYIEQAQQIILTEVKNYL